LISTRSAAAERHYSIASFHGFIVGIRKVEVNVGVLMVPNPKPDLLLANFFPLTKKLASLLDLGVTQIEKSLRY
jgi:hypothetical protein